MEKKRYVRAEQKLINIAVDSVLFTNSSSVGSSCTTQGTICTTQGIGCTSQVICPTQNTCPSDGTYNILFGLGNILFGSYNTPEPSVC